MGKKGNNREKSNESLGNNRLEWEKKGKIMITFLLFYFFFTSFPPPPPLPSPHPPPPPPFGFGKNVK